MMKVLQVLARSALRAWTLQTLQVKQKGLCRLCGLKIDPTVMGRSSDYVVDHCHETGQVRAVLHRSCNAAEGKVINAAGRWGAKSTKYADVIPYLEKLLAYYKWCEANPTGLMYPDHKTDDQKREAANLKRRKAYAAKAASTRVKANASKR